MTNPKTIQNPATTSSFHFHQGNPLSNSMLPHDDQPVHVNGFWFVMKWIFLFLLSLLLMSQLAILLQFRPRNFLKPNAVGFLAVSSFLTSFVLNVILETTLKAMARRTKSDANSPNKSESIDDQS